MLRETADHYRHEIIAPASEGDLHPFDLHRIDLRHCLKVFVRQDVINGHNHSALWAMSSHEFGRYPDIDDPAVINDRHAITESFRLFHEVRGQKDGRATQANASHQIP